MDSLALHFGAHVNLLWVICVILGSMLAGTIIRVLWMTVSPSQENTDRLASLKTWWALVLLFCCSVLLGRFAVAGLFALASCIGVREYLHLTSRSRDLPSIQTCLYLAVPLQFSWVVLGWFEPFWVTVPVAGLLVIAGSAAATGKTHDFLRDVATLMWGLLLLVFCLSHAAMFLALSESSNQVAGNAGWIVYLILLTESNDIAQALWGRQFGRHKVTPTVSPHKTWEGLLLGIATTILLAVVLAPILTPLHAGPTRNAGSVSLALPYVWSAIAGALIAISGFFGDISMSAFKRDVGVKDSSSLLPGQGGMLDRVDSLTFAAPVFFYFVYWLFP